MTLNRYLKQTHQTCSLGLLAVLFAGTGFVSACATTGSTKSSAMSAKPQVTIVQADDHNQLPEGEECTAASPTKGILNTESGMYKTINIKKGTHFIEEKATFQKEDTNLIVNQGGCAHFGVSYSFDIRHEGSIENKDMFLDVALNYLKSLDVNEGPHSNISTIQKIVAEKRTNPENVAACQFEDVEGYSSVRCSFQRRSEQRVTLKISYSIVL